MVTTLFLTLTLAFQRPVALPNETSLDTLQGVVEQQVAEHTLDLARDRQYESFREHKFEVKFNDVTKALADFGDSWNRNHEVDKRKVDRLRKAWHDLVKADAWFDTSADQQTNAH